MPSAPPQNLEAEQAVLGSMLLERDAIARAVEGLRPEDFYRDAHRVIFTAIIELFERGEPVDLITLTNRLAGMGKLEDVGGATYLASLPNVVPTAANVDYYAGILREKSDLRAVIAADQYIIARASNGEGDVAGLLTDNYHLIADIAARRMQRANSGLVPASELTDIPVEYVINRFAAKGMTSILSGRDKRGKTLLALEQARAVLLGTPFLGQFAAQRGAVAAYLLDDPESLTRARLTELGIVDHPNLWVCTSQRADLSDPMAFLRTTDREILGLDPRPVFVIFDALYLFVPAGREAGNDAARMGPVMDVINRIAEHTSAAVLLIAHDNKSGMDVAGSHVIRAASKFIVRVVLPDESADDPDDGPATPLRVLDVESKMTEAGRWRLDLQGVGRWVFLGTERDARKAARDFRADSTRAAVMAFLAKGNTGTGEEIAAATERRLGEIYAALRGLVKEGVATCKPEVGGAPGRPRNVYAAQPDSTGLKQPDGRDPNFLPER